MKYLSYEGLQYLYGKILTRLGLKVDASNGDISSTKISTFDTLSTEFPVPAAGESTKTVLGKIKKFITDFNSLKSSLLLLSMLTSQYENNTGKIPTAALVYALKQSLDATNSNLDNLSGNFNPSSANATILLNPTSIVTGNTINLDETVINTYRGIEILIAFEGGAYPARQYVPSGIFKIAGAYGLSLIQTTSYYGYIQFSVATTGITINNIFQTGWTATPKISLYGIDKIN